MSIGIHGTPPAIQAHGGTSTTVNYTLSGGARRVAIMAYCREDSAVTASSPTFDGNAMTIVEDPGDAVGFLRSYMWRYDIPDGMGDGAKAFAVTNSSSITNGGIAVWVLNDATSGAPTHSANNIAGSGDGVTNVAHTNGTPGFIVSSVCDNTSSQTVTWSGVTEREDATPGGGTRFSIADGAAAGNDAIQATASGTGGDRQLISAAFLEDLGSSSSLLLLRRRRAAMAFVSMSGPTMEAFGRIFNRTKTGLMLPEGTTA